MLGVMPLRSLEKEPNFRPTVEEARQKVSFEAIFECESNNIKRSGVVMEVTHMNLVNVSDGKPLT